MNFRTDTYTAITPFGIVQVDFPEDGGVVFDGAISAVEHLKAVISECTGSNGISLTPQNLEPIDFYHFCQPKGSMVTIMEPLDDLLSGHSPYRNNDDDEGDGYAVMDDASGMGMNLASVGNMSLLDMRRDLKMVPTVREKLTIMRAMLSHLNATGALAAQDEAVQPVAAGTPADAEPEDPIELTGKELGDFADTPDGKKAMRAAATATYDSLIQDGAWVRCPALNADVELRTKGRKKMISSSADTRKLKVVPKLKEIIATAKKIGSERQNYDISNSSNIISYQTMRSLVVIDGVELAIRLVLGRDDKGKYHYDHTIHGRDVVFDSEKANGPAETDPLILMGGSRGRTHDRSAMSKPYRLLSTEPSMEHQDDLIMDKADVDVNPTADAVEVFNLFIEGEEPEVVEAEDVESKAKAAQDVYVMEENGERFVQLFSLGQGPGGASEATLKKYGAFLKHRTGIGESNVWLISLDRYLANSKNLKKYAVTKAGKRMGERLGEAMRAVVKAAAAAAEQR